MKTITFSIFFYIYTKGMTVQAEDGRKMNEEYTDFVIEQEKTRQI